MATTCYVWDELSDTVLMEQSDAPESVASNTNAPEQFGEFISQHRTTTRYAVYDAQGSTRALTAGDESITNLFNYSGFGVMLSPELQSNIPFLFGGQYGYMTHSVSALIYVRSRHYLPNAGLWASRDPVESVLTSKLPYTYVANKPVLLADPSGLGVIRDDAGRWCDFCNVGEAFLVVVAPRFPFGPRVVAAWMRGQDLPVDSGHAWICYSSPEVVRQCWGLYQGEGGPLGGVAAIRSDLGRPDATHFQRFIACPSTIELLNERLRLDLEALLDEDPANDLLYDARDYLPFDSRFTCTTWALEVLIQAGFQNVPWCVEPYYLAQEPGMTEF